MILLQAVPPVPPVPDIPFDPNLAFEHITGPAAVMIVLAVMTAFTIVLWPIARAIARRLEGKAGVTPALQGELDQMHQRLAEVDALHQRVTELEERLDFTERLLARAESQATLPRGTT